MIKNVNMNILLIQVLISLFILSCSSEKNEIFECPKINITANFPKNAQIYLLADFNNWTLTSPMEYKNFQWETSLSLPPGNYGYLFYSKKDKKRYFDKNNQLTIYKDDIKSSKLTVEDCKYPHLKLKRFQKDKNSYSFTVEYSGINSIDLKNSKIYLNDKITNDFLYKDKKFHINKKNIKKGKYTYLFKIRDKLGLASKSLFIPIWIENKEFSWKDAIIYQIMTDRFKNGNLNNDAPILNIDKKANWQGGDYTGIIQKLNDNYFTNLGINTIWLSSPILNTSKAGKGMGNDNRYYAPYHSYWPIATGYTDFQHLDNINSPLEPHFGTKTELTELINKAHSKNIRVLFDVIPNHVHTDSYMWQNYNAQNWFHLDKNQNPYICGWEQPIVCWFNRYLADINHKNNDATMFVINHLIWLAKEYNVDGFRIDAVRLMIPEFTENFNYYIKKELETTGIKFYTIGENFTSEVENDIAFDIIGEYLGENKLTGLFNFPLFHELSRTFLLQNESFIEFEEFLIKNITKFQNKYYKDAIMGNFIGNHDLARAISIANNDFTPNQTNGGSLANERVWRNEVTTPDNITAFKKLTMTQTLLFTLPDIPVIYQGDEFGLPGANDPDNRRMMIFAPDLTELQTNTLQKFKKLTNLRNKHNSTKSKNFTTLFLTENTWAYYKKDEEDFIIVIVNTGEDIDIELQLDNLNLDNNTYLFNIFNGNSYLVENNQIKLRIKQMESIVLITTI